MSKSVNSERNVDMVAEENIRGLKKIFKRVSYFWARIVHSDDKNRLNYSLMLVCALGLTFIGLLMVLSASGPESMNEGDTGYALVARQGIWAVVGFVVMMLFSRLSVKFFRRFSWAALLVTLILLAMVIVTPLGHTINGNRNWLKVGGLTAQPSEAAKLVLVLWLAAVLTTKKTLITQWKHLVIPIVPGAGMVIVFVLLGHDLGTALILLLIIFAALFFAGIPLRFFGFSALIGSVGVGLLTVMQPYRMERIQEWFSGNPDLEGIGWQAQNGLYALASGGFFGKGLGASHQKWSWIPEAHSDYIFSILGEELGLVGTIFILAMFTLLCSAMIRVALSSQDRFVKISSGSVAAWIAVQGFINIGMVVGLLPVIGVPLPFISYGGSALTFTLAAVGVVMAFARQESKIKNGSEKLEASSDPA